MESNEHNEIQEELPKEQPQEQKAEKPSLSTKENKIAEGSPLLSSDEIEEQEYTTMPGEEFFEESAHTENATFHTEIGIPEQGNQALAEMLAGGYAKITPQILLAIFSPRAAQMQQLDATTRTEVEGIKQMLSSTISIDEETEKSIKVAIANYLKTVNFTAPTPLQALIMALAMPLFTQLFVGFQMKASMDELIRNAKKKNTQPKQEKAAA